MQLSSSLLRTLNSQENAPITIAPGSTLTAGAKAASSVTLRELDPPASNSFSKDKGKGKEKDKGRDWLALQLRETLGAFLYQGCMAERLLMFVQST